jgi:hypothetical protein
MTTKEQGIQALMEDHGLTEDAARTVAAAVVDGLTEFLKKRFVGKPVTLTTAKDVATACTEFYKTEVYGDIVDAIISYKRKGAGVALTDDQLKGPIARSRSRRRTIAARIAAPRCCTPSSRSKNSCCCAAYRPTSLPGRSCRSQSCLSMTRASRMTTDPQLRDYDDLSTWTTEALRNYEERLYDQECAGEDTWFERDQVLWELSRRDFGEGDAGPHQLGMDQTGPSRSGKGSPLIFQLD